MNLTETPETMAWPETDYVFLERVGAFELNAPQAWRDVLKLADAVMLHNKITGSLSLYKVAPQIYRAGFALEAAPIELPTELRYEKFPGGLYHKFVLTGSYAQLGEATARVFQIAQQRSLGLRDDYCIEYYVNDPRVTPEENLITEILLPAAGE